MYTTTVRLRDVRGAIDCGANAIARALELYREPLSGAAFSPVTIYNHATGTFIVVRANGTLVCE